MKTVRLTQIDGKLPNLALMKLARYYKDRGDRVVFSRRVSRDLFEPPYDTVYASAIFAFSATRLGRLLTEWPGAVIGGTGSGTTRTVESLIGDHPGYDYSIYPEFTASIGFTQRGCRLKCKFCVVPQKEGKNRSAATVADIWRGDPWPRRLHLLDNDFFGQPEDQRDYPLDLGRAVGAELGVWLSLVGSLNWRSFFPSPSLVTEFFCGCDHKDTIQRNGWPV